MDFLISTIVSGLIWDAIKSASATMGEQIHQNFSYAANRNALEAIHMKALEIKENHKKPFDKFQKQVDSDSHFVDAVSENVRYKTDFAKRLDYIITLNNLYSDKRINLEILGEHLGHDSVNDLKIYYTDVFEPTYAFISEVAKNLGVNEVWLKNGSGNPFRSEQCAYRAIDYYSTIEGTNPESIIFCLSSKFDLGIVLKLNKFKYIYCDTTWHFNENVGGTGKSHIFSVYQLIKRLKDKDKLYICDVLHFGNETFDKIFYGLIPAASASKQGARRFSPIGWLEDFVNLRTVEEYGTRFKFCQDVVRDFLKSSN